MAQAAALKVLQLSKDSREVRALTTLLTIMLDDVKGKLVDVRSDLFPVMQGEAVGYRNLLKLLDRPVDQLQPKDQA